MSTEKIREEFERAYMASMDTDLPSFVWLERRADGSYASGSTKAAWWAWQASRAAIEVELPPRWSNQEGDWYEDDDGSSLDYQQTKEAIESLGLKVKVKT